MQESMGRVEADFEPPRRREHRLLDTLAGVVAGQYVRMAGVHRGGERRAAVPCSGHKPPGGEGEAARPEAGAPEARLRA